ncbi:hypothetical protein BGZ83_002022 [Gryganskiella cystojenkinii]|nr:hypothetical protein BGZ83_002022 [Gryganskiella cystojenkinii]
MSARQRTLYVSGFSQRSRAKDLAFEFERYGPLIRCDVPALRTNSSRPYAFVEYEDDRDARDAYNQMKDVRFEGHRLSVQFAKNTPSASWRYERDGGDSRRDDRRDDRRGGGRNRSRSPPRRGRSPPRRRRSPSPRRRDGSPRAARSARSPVPADEPRRRSSGSQSPVRGRTDDRRRPSRSQSPVEEQGDPAEVVHLEQSRSRSASPLTGRRNDSSSPRGGSMSP